jgi:hypothetical protein
MRSTQGSEGGSFNDCESSSTWGATPESGDFFFLIPPLPISLVIDEGRWLPAAASGDPAVSCKTMRYFTWGGPTFDFKSCSVEMSLDENGVLSIKGNADLVTPSPAWTSVFEWEDQLDLNNGRWHTRERKTTSTPDLPCTWRVSEGTTVGTVKSWTRTSTVCN